MASTKINTADVDVTTTYSLLIALITAIALAAGSYFAYQQGYLNPLIEKVGVMVFKAKAVAEAKEMQAKGMTAGKDFVGSQLDGNQEAEDVKKGLGSIGGLKKDL